MVTGNSHLGPSLTRLLRAQAALGQSESGTLGRKYMVAVLNETVAPLEAINNLVYIVKQEPHGSESLPIYLDMIEGELRRLNKVVQQTLEFCDK